MWVDGWVGKCSLEQDTYRERDTVTINKVAHVLVSGTDVQTRGREGKQ